MYDEVAIQQTLNTYSFHASQGQLEEMTATFIPDGVWEVPDINAKFEGREAILAGAKAVGTALEFNVQINAPAVIKVEGNRATAQSVIRECAKYVGKPLALEILGSYTDDLVRTAEGWRFAKRVFRVRGTHDFTVAPPSLFG